MEAATRPLNAKVWERQEADWYVEDPWVSRRLFDVEEFSNVWDPACGRGNIITGGALAGVQVTGTDLVGRSGRAGGADFLKMDDMPPLTFDIVTNQPFDLSREFALHALSLIAAGQKVAMIFPTRRLNAAGAWLRYTPLKRLLYLTPRPSMPPGEIYEELAAQGKHPSGGKQDFVWLIWQRGYIGPPTFSWLHRDKGRDVE